MKRPVMLDTSFLITYTDSTRAHHATARDYFREAVRIQVPMLLSSIVVAEFERRQQVNTLGLRNFRILPFNFDDGQEAARLANALFPKDATNDRVSLLADVKIIAQAKRANAADILTDDADSMTKYIDGLRGAGHLDCYAVLNKDGFDSGRLISPSSPGLQFPPVTTSSD